MSTLFGPEISSAIINTGIATLILIVALSLMSWFFPWIQKKIQSVPHEQIPSLKIHNFEIITAQSLIAALCSFLKAVRLTITVLGLYFYFSLVLGFFPETAHLSNNMLHYILDPLKEVLKTIVDYVPKAIYVVVICLVMRYILKVIRLFFIRIEGGYIKIDGFHAEWAQPTYNLVRILVFAFTLIIIFPHLPGSSSPAFQGVSVFLGLLISLGSSSAISNMVAGLVITYMRPFQVGDRVKLGTTIGDVVEKNLLVTRIRTIKNVDVTIPNSNVLNSHIINYSAVADSKGLILNPRINIGYDVNWRKVHELMMQAASRTEGVLQDPKPFVFQVALDSSYVQYELNAYTRLANNFDDVYSDLYKNIQDLFNEAQVEIMSPTYHALRDGEGKHIPAEYST